MSLRYAHVTAGLALAVTVAGGAAAAVRVPEGGVGTRALEAGAVTKPKLHPNAVERLRVRKGSLKRRDLSRIALEQGPQGPTGAHGPIGPAGPASVAMVKYVTSTRTVSAGATVGLSAACPSGTAYGGGVSIGGVEKGDAAVAHTYPPGSRSWRAVVVSEGTTPRAATLTVICVSKN